MEDEFNSIDLRKQLSFCEAIIVTFNMNQVSTQGSFIATLDTLIQNTEDERLLGELNNLLSKIKDMTNEEFASLHKDTLLGRVVFPPDYSF